MGNFILVRRVAEKKKLNPVDLAGIGNLLECQRQFEIV